MLPPTPAEFRKQCEAAALAYPVIHEAAAQAAEERDTQRAITADDLGKLAAARVKAAKDKEAIDRAANSAPSGQDKLSNPDIKLRFGQSLDSSIELFSRFVLLAPPSMEQFIAAGTDFNRLVDTIEHLESKGREAAILFTPIMPLALGSNSLNVLKNQRSFRNLYKQLTEDKTIPNNPLKNYEDNGEGEGPGLWVDSEVYQLSQELYDQELHIAQNSQNTHYVEQDDMLWTVSVVDATPKPSLLNLDHEASLDAIQAEYPDAEHISLSQYLTLQAIRLQDGQPPIDGSTWSWTNQTFTGNDGSARAVCVNWYSDVGQVSVNWGGVGDRSSSLGARLSVWG
jgi:hypothetical protein